MPADIMKFLMDIKAITSIFSVRDLRNAVFGTIVVIVGLGLALFTLYAHNTGNQRAAGIAAVVAASVCCGKRSTPTITGRLTPPSVTMRKL